MPRRSHFPVRQYTGQYTILAPAPDTPICCRCCRGGSCLAPGTVLLLLLATPPLGFRVADAAPAADATLALPALERRRRAAASAAAAAAAAAAVETSLKRERRCTPLPLLAAEPVAAAAPGAACWEGPGCTAANPNALAGTAPPAVFAATTLPALASAAACPLGCRCSDRERPLPPATCKGIGSRCTEEALDTLRTH